MDVWPEHKQSVPLDQAVCYVVFDDNDQTSDPLIERLLVEESRLRAVQPPDWLGGGGIKICDISERDSSSDRGPFGGPARELESGMDLGL